VIKTCIQCRYNNSAPKLHIFKQSKQVGRLTGRQTDRQIEKQTDTIINLVVIHYPKLDHSSGFEKNRSKNEMVMQQILSKLNLLFFTLCTLDLFITVHYFSLDY
jgi:hypothetical protein